MVVAKPIKKEPKVDIDALINKGGSVASERVIQKDEKILLAVPGPVAANIQKAIAIRKAETGMNLKRTPWILEAIVEKLKREGA